MSLLFSLLADPGPVGVDLFILIRESEPSLFLEQEAVSPQASVCPDTSKTGQLSRLSRQIRGSHTLTESSDQSEAQHPDGITGSFRI